MIKRLISFFLTLVLLVAIPLEARYRYNPYTAKLDYYEAAEDVDLGDLGDLTLTGLATGNILYYDGAAWVNLATGVNAEVLTLAAGIPSWAAGGAPAAHAASHEVGGADLVDHDQLTNYLAAQHLTLPNTLVAVLTDHNAAAHVALGFLALPSTIAAVLTDHTQVAHNALNIDADTVDGEHAAAIVTNARVKTHFPDTIVNVLSDHNLAAHTALGLFDASADVNHDATTNWVANKHIDWTNATQNLSTQGSATLNDNGSTGEIGLNLYSINNTFSMIAQSDAEGIAGDSDLRIGLDESLRAMYLLDRGDIGTDFGSIAFLYPSLVFVDAGANDYSYIAMEDNLWTFINMTGDGVWFETPKWFDFIIDGSGGDLTGTEIIRFRTLEDGTAEFVNNAGTQTWFEIEPWVNQTGTAAYNALVVDVTETGIGTGTNELLTLQVGSTDVFTIGNKGSLDLTMSHLASRVVIAQSAVAGTEDVPLINIDDDRTGLTANEASEATIYIDADGVYAFTINDGDMSVKDVYAGSVFMTAASGIRADNRRLMVGAGDDYGVQFGTNGAGDDLAIFGVITGGTNTAALWYSTNTLVPSGMTEHDDYLSPTFVMVNDEGADANDYAGVVIGERTQADVKIAHYFDFYAMTGAADGSVDVSNTELAAIFRFGASGSTVPTYATTPGDVLFEGKIEATGILITDLLSFPATRNIVLGDATPAAFGTAIANIFLGLDAGTSTTEGDYNVSIGEEAGYYNQTGIGSVKIGYKAGKGAVNKSDGYNVIIGHLAAGFGALEGNSFNVVLGNESGYNLTNGTQNFLLGYRAGYTLTTQHNNVLIGGLTGKDSAGHGNTGIGYAAMAGGIGAWAGSYNVAIGYNTMVLVKSGSGNIGIGREAGYYMEGTGNVLVGDRAGLGVTGNAYNYNVLIGTDAGKLITTSSSNVIIGYFSGDALTSGGDHVLVGEKAGSSLTTETGNVMIGHDAGENATASNVLYIANSNTVTPLIYGEFANTLLTFTATNVGVVGITNLGDGGTTNYASFAADGTLSLAGTARANVCFQFANANLGKGAVVPDEIIVGNYWGWSYDIDDDSVFTIKLPDDYASGTDVEIHIRWAVNEAYITNSGEVRWQATWSAHPADASEAIDDAGTTDDSGDINIPATAYFLTQTLIETIPGGSLSPGDELGITIKRIALVGGADPVADPVVTCVGFIYTVDKLGT